jgi:ribulose bisphosphate carboxylase small subunit
LIKGFGEKMLNLNSCRSEHLNFVVIEFVDEIHKAKRVELVVNLSDVVNEDGGKALRVPNTD